MHRTLDDFIVQSGSRASSLPIALTCLFVPSIQSSGTAAQCQGFGTWLLTSYPPPAAWDTTLVQWESQVNSALGW